MNKPAAVVVVLSVLLVMPVKADMIHDVCADFSIDNGNPNGVWTYGEMPIDFSYFTPFTSTEIVYGTCPVWYPEAHPPEVWRNDSGGEIHGIQPGDVALHPRANHAPSVVRWTAPASGSFSVVGQFLAGDSGLMQVGIRQGSEWLWQTTDAGAFNLDVSTAAGSSLDFVVYGGYAFGNTGLEATVTKTSTVRATLNCEPSTGIVPFSTQLTINLENLYLEQSRRFAARIDVDLASGTSYPNWRAGFTNLPSGASYSTSWLQNIPAIGMVIGDNLFQLVVEDVTPAPYNQPPYSAAGDTDSVACTVTAATP